MDDFDEVLAQSIEKIIAQQILILAHHSFKLYKFQFHLMGIIYNNKEEL